MLINHVENLIKFENTWIIMVHKTWLAVYYYKLPYQIQDVADLIRFIMNKKFHWCNGILSLS